MAPAHDSDPLYAVDETLLPIGKSVTANRGPATQTTHPTLRVRLRVHPLTGGARRHDLFELVHLAVPVAIHVGMDAGVDEQREAPLRREPLYDGGERAHAADYHELLLRRAPEVPAQCRCRANGARYAETSEGGWALRGALADANVVNGASGSGGKAGGKDCAGGKARGINGAGGIDLAAAMALAA
eukprot:gene12224-biopygen13305